MKVQSTGSYLIPLYTPALKSYGTLNLLYSPYASEVGGFKDSSERVAFWQRSELY